MTNSKSTLFISDLHLDKNRPDISKQFLQLLNGINQNINALYILGDLFETWIGDDYELSHYHHITNALKTVTQKGVPVYFLHGNRDFLVGKAFLQATGCQLLQDETTLNLYGEPVLIMHGDTLCTRDIAYMKARNKIRNRFVQWLFLHLPFSIREKIANEMREKSMQHTSSTAYDIMDVTQEEVLRVMQKHRTPWLIHGHTHRPGFHQFTLQDKPAERIVLGAWHERGNMLIWHESGEKEWVEF